MRFIPYLAPYKVAILPLNKKYHGEKAKEFRKKNLDNYISYIEKSKTNSNVRYVIVLCWDFLVYVEERRSESGKQKYN